MHKQLAYSCWQKGERLWTEHATLKFQVELRNYYIMKPHKNSTK